MNLYQHILVAIDLSDESRPVIIKAKRIAESLNADLSLVHVMEPVPPGYGTAVPMYLNSVQEEIETKARERLQELALTAGVPTDGQYLRIGKPKTEIHAVAEENNIDLVVIGSHGRDGLGLILGSTANSVLHGANCDVLTVRVGEK